MVTGLGIAALICGGLSAVLWIPAIWVPWISIIGVACAIAACVLGYFGNKQFEQRCAYMQQQAAAYGQPFKKPFNLSKLALLLGGIGGAMNVICLMNWVTMVPYMKFVSGIR
ncbi:MAG: hypothetical protein IK127_04895 [Clostridia bacterium]|nr:hypothetical protein [Clostridia bacterium]